LAALPPTEDTATSLATSISPVENVLSCLLS